jgi:hypothetical protein
MASKSQQVPKYLTSGAKISRLDILVPDSCASLLQELLARVAQLEASLSGFKKNKKIKNKK